MSGNRVLHLFEAFGVELEYMIVHRDGLSVFPATDQVLKAVTGEYVSDYEQDDISWSNELALHVIELKTSAPATDLRLLPAQFLANVRRINEVLEGLQGRLLPSAMHPFMDPHAEMQLWPHDYSPVYEAFNRIFDCNGHGWANLQSVHLNLPFSGDEEFGRLHAAIRLILPILPALAASSPVCDGRMTGMLDTRLDVYRKNARRIPFVSGDVIPEPVYTRADYEQQILQKLYDEIAPLDPEGILQDEFLNARGAIARFCRNAIEIRVLDVQECPQADVAICALIVRVLQLLTEGVWTSTQEQQAVPTAPLKALLLRAIDDAEQAAVDDPQYLRHFGRSAGEISTAQQLWRSLADEVFCRDAAFEQSWREPLDVILEEGPLARRILRRLHGDVSPAALQRVYGELADCLQSGRMLRG